jgi:hypothetical protein
MFIVKTYFVYFVSIPLSSNGRRGRDRTVVGFTTTSAIGAYHH